VGGGWGVGVGVMGRAGLAQVLAGARPPPAARPHGPAAASPPISWPSRPVLPRDTQVAMVALGSGVGP
jgi:hypothetical protein